MQEQMIENPIDFTPKALSKVKELMKNEGKEGHGLRIRLVPGGCAGFQYDFAIEKDASDGDKVIKNDGLRVFVDETSLQFMEGSTVDYIETLHEAGFRVNNPNFEHSCSCGKSVG